MNELKQIDAFRKVLTNYQLSDDAKAILAQTKLLLLVGPTSSGKNTIISELLNTGNYHNIVSDTTRKPRMNNGILEQNGREYWFRTEEELLADLQAGNFLEAAIIHDQQVSGISMRELSAAAQEGKVAVNEIEYIGADNVHTAKPDALFVFVVPPSFDEWMVRMRLRGELPEDEVRRRLESAVKEIGTALDRPYYHFLVNDTYVRTTRDLQDFVDGKPSDDSRAREVAAEVLADTQAYLAA